MDLHIHHVCVCIYIYKFKSISCSVLIPLTYLSNFIYIFLKFLYVCPYNFYYDTSR